MRVSYVDGIFPSHPHSVKGGTHACFGRGDGRTRKPSDDPLIRALVLLTRMSPSWFNCFAEVLNAKQRRFCFNINFRLTEIFKPQWWHRTPLTLCPLEIRGKVNPWTQQYGWLKKTWTMTLSVAMPMWKQEKKYALGNLIVSSLPLLTPNSLSWWAWSSYYMLGKWNPWMGSLLRATIYWIFSSIKLWRK